MNTRHMLAASVFAAMLASAVPASVIAAPIEIAASTKSSLDKTIAQTDRAQADEIRSLYDEFVALQKQQREWDEKIKSIHAGNRETMTALGKQIKQIDAAAIDRLKSELTQAQERHKPLLTRYSSPNKQLEEARNLKNKELSSLLRVQIGVLKIPVQLARADIKTKDTAWRTAKDSAAKKMKDIRGTLADSEPVNQRIKAAKSAVKTTESDVTPVLNAFKLAAKKGDAKGIADSLASLVSFSRQINEQKQAIFRFESQISGILSAAKTELP